MKKLLLILFFFSLTFISYSSYVKDYPIELQQPDGSIINCLISGDEYYQRVYTEDNYTVIRDKNTGYYVYAVLENNKLQSSGIIVGNDISKNSKIIPGIDIPEKDIIEIRKEIKSKRPKDIIYKQNDNKSGTTLTMNIITVFIKFADSDEFNSPFSTYYNMYNSTTSSSAYTYFKDASHGELDVLAAFYPQPEGDVVASYTDIYPRSYYCPYDENTNPNGYEGNEEWQREQDLVRRALNAVKSQIPSSLELDTDNDGYIDNINFIVKGNTTAWSSLLWPHKTSFWGDELYVNGVQAGTYNLHIENHLLVYNTSVIVHETYHSFGIPDLYHYSDNGSPVGIWDIMAENTNPPQATAAYLKNKYTMFSRPINEITSSGTYSINQTWKENDNCYKIKTTGNSINNEFFIVECRNKYVNWENQIPASGLLVYRVNPNYEGNADGNDELTVINSTLNSAAMGRNYNRTYLSNISVPKLQFSDGSSPNFGIFNISNSDTVMTFEVIYNSGLSVYPNSIVFPDNSVLEPSTEKTVSLVPFNVSGTIDLQIVGVDAQFFEITEFNQSNPTNIIKVRFLPNNVRQYSAQLKISNGTISKYVNLSGEGIIVPLVASFNVSTNQTIVGNSVQFTDNSSGTPSSWFWTFEGGNPSTSTDRNPVVTYSTPGTYSVQLYVENQYNTDDSVFHSIIIEDIFDNLSCNSGFENWNNPFPNCWNGNTNEITSSHVVRVDSNTYEGNYSCKIINGMTNAFLNFSTKPITVENGNYYKVEFYVKGKGKIFVSLYDERESNYGFSPDVEATQIDTNDYILFSQTVKALNTSDNAEFVIKVASTNVAKNHLTIDDFSVQQDTLTNISFNHIVDFDVFPNPSQNGIFTINLSEKLLIEIYNTMGVLLKTEQIFEKQEINLNEFPGGVYYIKATNEKNHYNVKQIVIL